MPPLAICEPRRYSWRISYAWKRLQQRPTAPDTHGHLRFHAAETGPQQTLELTAPWPRTQPGLDDWEQRGIWIIDLSPVFPAPHATATEYHPSTRGLGGRPRHPCVPSPNQSPSRLRLPCAQNGRQYLRQCLRHSDPSYSQARLHLWDVRGKLTGKWVSDWRVVARRSTGREGYTGGFVLKP